MASSRVRRSVYVLVLLSLATALSLALFTSAGLSGPGGNVVSVKTTMPQTRTMDLDAPIGVIFSGDVAPDSLVDVRLSSPPAVISPAVEGTWRWTTRRWLSFTPDDSYRPDAVYVLRVDAKKIQRNGLTLQGDDRFEFTAAPFRCVRSSLSYTQVGGRRREMVLRGRWDFNAPVDEDAFRNAVTLRYDGDVIADFDLTSSSDGTTISLESAPVTMSQRKTDATATVADGLRSRAGGQVLTGAILDRSRVSGFEELQIRNVEFDCDGLDRYVEIDFSHNVDARALREALSIEPEVKNLSVRRRWRSVLVYGDWEAGRRYDLSISGDLATNSGQSLINDFTRSLTVGDYDRWLGIAAAGNYLPSGATSVSESPRSTSKNWT